METEKNKTNMKTQIKNLRIGKKVQITNPILDYPKLVVGSNKNECDSVWENVTKENPNEMKIKILGLDLILKANWSVSRKSVSYWGEISKEDLEKIFKIRAAKKHENGYVSIQCGNLVKVGNWKNSYTDVCPSLVEIL